MQSVIYHIPVFGWALKEAVQGPATAKTLFVINLALVWLLAVITFGYPAIIIPALAFVPVMFTILLALTWPCLKA
jgi:hypothetical protein